MKHFLRKIDASGLFVEDVFFDDEATEAVPETPAVLDEDGVVLTPAVPAIPAFAGHPVPSDLIATPPPGGFYRPRWVGGQWVEGGGAPVPTVDQIVADITTDTQARLDAFARTRNYDGILSACTYATSTHPQFAAEGQYCVTARDATWSALYVVVAEVEAGTRPMPTGYQDIEPDLPALVWPA